MGDERHSNHDTSAIYRIRFRGHLDDHWASWFDGMRLVAADDGTSLLEGVVVDSTALYGLICHLRDLGLTLIDVHQVAPPRADAK